MKQDYTILVIFNSGEYMYLTSDTITEHMDKLRMVYNKFKDVKTISTITNYMKL